MCLCSPQQAPEGYKFSKIYETLPTTPTICQTHSYHLSNCYWVKYNNMETTKEYKKAINIEEKISKNLSTITANLASLEEVRSWCVGL